MSVQRRRGLSATVYKTTATTDRRGNRVRLPDDEAEPYYITAAFVPQTGRTVRAEVPGQLEMEVVSMICTHELHDVDMWTRVEAMGRTWDVIGPANYYHGTRHTRHWTVDLRRRSDG